MSSGAREARSLVDLESSTLLRILRKDEEFDPYEEMQKLANLIAIVAFDSVTGQIQIYSGCIMIFNGRRLLDEKRFKLSEDGSFLVSCHRHFSVNDAMGVYKYINDLLFVRRRVPKNIPNLN